MSELKNWKWLTPAEISRDTGVPLDAVCDALPRLLAAGRAEAGVIRSHGVELPVFRSADCSWA